MTGPPGEAVRAVLSTRTRAKGRDFLAQANFLTRWEQEALLRGKHLASVMYRPEKDASWQRPCAKDMLHLKVVLSAVYYIN